MKIRQISAAASGMTTMIGCQKSQSSNWKFSPDNHLVTAFPSSLSSLLWDCLLCSWVFLMTSSTVTPLKHPTLFGTTQVFPFQAHVARRCSRAISPPSLEYTQRSSQRARSHGRRFHPPPWHQSTLAPPVFVPSGPSERYSRQCASMTSGATHCQSGLQSLKNTKSLHTISPV